MQRIALLLFSLGAGTTALSGDLTLTFGVVGGASASPHFQIRDPNGSNRNVLLPVLTGTNSESTGIWYVIRNAGSANNLVIKDSTGVTTYATLTPGDWVWMVASGASPVWKVAAGSVGQSSLTLTGALNAASAAISGGLAAVAGAFTGRLTTTDSVASGDARIVGGNIHTKITSSTLTNTTTETTLATHTMPANTLKAGTTVRIRGAVRVTGNAAADTLLFKLRLGGTAIVTTTASAMVANDIARFDLMITSRAAPSAASAVAAEGEVTISVGGTHGTKGYVYAPVDYATNGALAVDLRGTWSAASASDIAICESFVVDVVA